MCGGKDGVDGKSLPPSQFCCKLKSALKNKVLKNALLLLSYHYDSIKKSRNKEIPRYKYNTCTKLLKP